MHIMDQLALEGKGAPLWNDTALVWGSRRAGQSVCTAGLDGP